MCRCHHPIDERRSSTDDEPANSKRQRIAEMHERTRLFGGAQKQSAYTKVLLEKWSRFLLLHGEEHGEPPDLVARRGPSVALVKAFTTYCYFRCPETAQCRYELLLRHMLAKFVFVWLAYPGWAGVSGYALAQRAEQYNMAVKEQWERLKRGAQMDQCCGLARTLKPFVRPQWCTAEGFYCEQAKRYRNREAYHLIFGMSFATSG